MDSWACSDCKSLNKARAKRCYKCNAPRAHADASRPGGEDGSRPAGGGLAAYRRATLRATAVIVGLLATVAVTAISAVTFGSGGGLYPMLVSLVTHTDGTVASDTVVWLLGTRLTLLAVTGLSWLFWFDRVIRNVPALGAGWVGASRLGAVLWWFIPLGWFIRPPFIVGDAYSRLSVKGTAGMWLILLWWVAFIGAFAVPGIGAQVLPFFPIPTDRAALANDVLGQVGLGLEIIAGLLAVAIVLSMQRAQKERASTLAAAAPAAEPASAPAADTGAMPSGALVVPGASAYADGAASGTAAAPRITFGAPGAKSKRGGGPSGASGTRRRIPLIPLAIVLGIVVASVGIGVVIARSPGDRPATPLPTPPRLGTVGPSVGPTPSPLPAATLTQRFQRLLADPDLSLRVSMKGDARAQSALYLRYASDVVISGSDGSAHVRIQSPQSGSDETTDRVLVGQTTYIRTDKGAWTQRPRTATDRVDAFLGLTADTPLVDGGTARLGGQLLHRLRWPKASLDFGQAMFDSAWYGVTVRSASAVVWVTGTGLPIHMDMHLTATTQAGRPLAMDIDADYDGVGKAIGIEAPSTGR